MTRTTFKSEKLGKIQSKKEQEKKLQKSLLWSTIFIAIAYFFCLVTLRKYVLWAAIGFFIVTVAWMIFILRATLKMQKVQTTRKEDLLYNLHAGIHHLSEFTNNPLRDPKQFKLAEEYFGKFLSECRLAKMSLPEFGTEIEEKMAQYYKHIHTILKNEILKDINMSSPEPTLRKVLTTLEEIFHTIQFDDYENSLSEISTKAAKYETPKQGFLEKIKLDKENIVNTFWSIIIMVVTFSLFWLCKYLFEVDISLMWGIGTAIVMPKALSEGRKFVSEVRK